MADADSTNTPQWSTAPLPVAEERLPSLAIALDPERMKAVFAPWVHERFGDAGIENLEIEVYRRHINRCVVRYTVECQVKGDGRRTTTAALRCTRRCGACGSSASIATRATG